MAGIILGIAALLVSGVSVYFARNSSRASARSAKVAEAINRRDRQPQIEITRGSPATRQIDNVIYTVRNDGPQALDDVIIHRPRSRNPDGIIYPIGITGQDYAEDEIHLGPMPLTGEARFTLCCGGAEHLPQFRVHIQFYSAGDEWEGSYLLPDPRGAMPRELRFNG